METEYAYLLHLPGFRLREEAPGPAAAVDWQKLIEPDRLRRPTKDIGL